MARALEVVGERWSLLIIRDALYAGVTRFRDFQRRLGIAPNVLAARLDGFVRAGLMERYRFSEHSGRHEYRLTEKGADLLPVIVALVKWGDRWASPDGPRLGLIHAGCGGPIEQLFSCSICGRVGDPSEVEAHSLRWRAGRIVSPNEPSVSSTSAQ